MGIDIRQDGLLHEEPLLPAAHMTTYGFVMRRRPATCAEVNCENYLHGWKTIVPVGSEAEQVVRSVVVPMGYKFTEERIDGNLIELVFEPGQRCFQSGEHTLPWDDQGRLYKRGGDWRGNPRGEMYEFQRADDWIDDFAGHQDRLATRLERG